MSRTYRNERIKERTHDRSECPWCQENLHHKHHKAPLFEEEEEFEPDSVLESEDD
jgi:hypothetical protein